MSQREFFVDAVFFFSSRRRHTRFDCDWSSDVCSSDLEARVIEATADANEKQGLADAKVLEERLLAQARGEAQVGATKATVTRDVGMSEADVLRDKLYAEAKGDRKSTRLNSSHSQISYAVFCLK